MIELTTGTRNWDEVVELTPGFHADLHWWQQLLKSWNGCSVFPERHWTDDADLEFYSDACTTGYGAYCAGEWIAGPFSGWLYKRSMPFKELFALVAAVATWGKRWCGKSRIRVPGYSLRMRSP
ncbi:MAG: hypothetical protein GY696_21400 [Gammaproteobacteria bacterium]|nr:hypothetical protein [Gammaproteobacteria bacterium]